MTKSIALRPQSFYKVRLASSIHRKYFVSPVFVRMRVHKRENKICCSLGSRVNVTQRWMNSRSTGNAFSGWSDDDNGSEVLNESPPEKSHSGGPKKNMDTLTKHQEDSLASGDPNDNVENEGTETKNSELVDSDMEVKTGRDDDSYSIENKNEPPNEEKLGHSIDNDPIQQDFQEELPAAEFQGDPVVAPENSDERLVAEKLESSDKLKEDATDFKSIDSLVLDVNSVSFDANDKAVDAAINGLSLISNLEQNEQVDVKVDIDSKNENIKIREMQGLSGELLPERDVLDGGLSIPVLELAMPSASASEQNDRDNGDVTERAIFDSMNLAKLSFSASTSAPSALSPPLQAFTSLQSSKVIEGYVHPGDIFTRREYNAPSRNTNSKLYLARNFNNVTKLTLKDITPDDSSIQGFTRCFQADEPVTKTQDAVSLVTCKAFATAAHSALASIAAPSLLSPSLKANIGKELVVAVGNQNQWLALELLRALKVIEDGVQPYDLCTRRAFARYLVAASNTLSRNKVHHAYFKNQTKLAFDDVPPGDTDFSAIQGLAKAGVIDSNLSQVESSMNFYPDSPLSRQDFVTWIYSYHWKTLQRLPIADRTIPLQPFVFKDIDKINSYAWPALLADLSAGEKGVVRHAFGSTRLFLPDEPMTNAQAVVALATVVDSDIVDEGEPVLIKEKSMADIVWKDNKDSEKDCPLEREKMVALEKEVEERKQKMVALEKEVEETKQKMVALEKEVNKGKQKMVALEKELKEGKQKMAALEKEVKEGKQKMAALEKEVKEGKQKMAALEKEVKEGKQKMAALEKEVEERKQKMFALEKKVEEGMQEMVALVIEVEEGKQEMGSLEKEVEERKQEMGSLEKEVEEREQKMGALEKELKQRKQRMVTLEKEVKQRKQRMVALEKGVEETKQRVRKEQRKQQINNLSDTLKKREKERSNKDAEIGKQQEPLCCILLCGLALLLFGFGGLALLLFGFCRMPLCCSILLCCFLVGLALFRDELLKPKTVWAKSRRYNQGHEQRRVQRKSKYRRKAEIGTGYGFFDRGWRCDDQNLSQNIYRCHP